MAHPLCRPLIIAATLPLAWLAGCGGDSDPVDDNACLQLSPAGQS